MTQPDQSDRDLATVEDLEPMFGFLRISGLIHMGKDGKLRLTGKGWHVWKMLDTLLPEQLRFGSLSDEDYDALDDAAYDDWDES
jgi:hypothetical protein